MTAVRSGGGEPPPPTRIRLRIRMSARPVDEPHRVSSQLELLFDLTFVVAVAAVTAQLAHEIVEGHAGAGVVPFLQVFFAIWWAWMNFTWFASSYDTDDVAYRVLTMVQMGGVLVLAAGVPAAGEHGDYRFVTLGYVIMRSGLVAQWLRVAAEDPARRRTALRYGGGITILTAAWMIHSWVAPASVELPLFVLLAVLELAVPRWAERAEPTTWHPHHIAERYGLFVIILLGESVLAASRGVASALETSAITSPFLMIAVSGLVMLFALWWLYFLVEAGEGLSGRRDRSYRWGYGHYGIFAALAALGAGLEVAVEQSGHHVAAAPLTVAYAVAIPVGVFLLLLWLVHTPVEQESVIRPAVISGCAAVVLALPLTARWIGVHGVATAIAAACVLAVAITVGASARRRRPAPVADGTTVTAPQP
ncbi:FIG00761799: membrane protein [[Actinomadura] parvosata subsp. kistnae]|uniref:Low temperature requirement protein A n=1 Tax=[Actinomadura] parvosata subsp. kistnae TaxID=1909395 RepID=A0A1U9ZUU2_9ACTN|nr:low temperature requirement protein A [Nonomuraea sp. ATCC 55076]AQZ61708.1 low temperature requirement protein A [Nonomuraea sp. ATCC 55076]SPL87818.1 FIG00761799: membrane protein [Actinomadura parvosata subsp. kistnae]